MIKKKVLILAWDFPPYTGIGAARPYSWYTNLSENDISPIVVTRHWDPDFNFKEAFIRSSKNQIKTVEKTDLGTLIKVPYKSNFRDRLILKYGYNKFSLIRKVISFSQFILAFPFFYFDNKNEIFKAADKFLKEEKVDLIIATGEPFILHKYAYILSKKHMCPYVLDYRDGWTTRDDNLNLKGINKILNNFYFRFFEKRYLKKSKFILTSNPFEQEKLKYISPNINLKNVYNGYVEEEVNFGKNTDQLSDIFRIGYAGTIYPFNCVEEFLEGLKKFITRFPNSKLKFMLLGINNQPVQLNRIKSYNPALLPYISSSDRMDKADLIKWFCKCNCLLIFTSPNIKLLPSKIYEYLPLKRKILVSLNDRADIEKIMRITNAGYNCNSSEEICNAIEDMYNEFIDTGMVKSNVRNYNQFSRKNQTKHLAEIIKSEI